MCDCQLHAICVPGPMPTRIQAETVHSCPHNTAERVAYLNWIQIGTQRGNNPTFLLRPKVKCIWAQREFEITSLWKSWQYLSDLFTLSWCSFNFLISHHKYVRLSQNSYFPIKNLSIWLSVQIAILKNKHIPPHMVPFLIPHSKTHLPKRWSQSQGKLLNYCKCKVSPPPI